MKNNYFRVFLILALPFLLLGMGATRGCIAGGGGIVLPDNTENETDLNLTQDLNYRAVVVGEVPLDATYTIGEIRVIVEGGDYENPFVTETLTDLSPGASITKTITGLFPESTYWAKFFFYDDETGEYSERSNETIINTALKTVYTESFGHSTGYSVVKEDNDTYWTFIGSMGLESTTTDEAAILYIPKDTPPVEGQELIKISGGEFDYNLVADIEGSNLVVCDLKWGDPADPSYKDRGKCYLWYDIGLLTEDFSVDDTSYSIRGSKEGWKLGSAFAIDPVSESLIVGARDETSLTLDECGFIHKHNQGSPGVVVQEGEAKEGHLGWNLMLLDYNGNGTTDMVFQSKLDKITRCTEVKICLDSFDCAGTVLHEASGEWCIAEGQGSTLMFPNNNFQDFNSDGFDDAVYLEVYTAQPYKARLTIYWGGENIDPENKFEFTSEGEIGFTVDTADMNADGVNDLVIMSQNHAYIYWNGDTSAAPTEILLPTGFGGATADVDNDGYGDFVRTETDFLSEYARFVISR